jgi:hypothetical protein
MNSEQLEECMATARNLLQHLEKAQEDQFNLLAAAAYSERLSEELRGFLGGSFST